MKKILFACLFLLITSSSLIAQDSRNSNFEADSSKIMLQTLLNPSLQNYRITTLPKTNYDLFDYCNNKALYYLNVFNSEAAKFLLAVISDNFELDDFPSYTPFFYKHRTAFQYNFIQSHNRLNYVSDDEKRAFW